MDTDLLKTFLEVRKTRHFGRAAENLYLTQAAVSARIKQLETLIGDQLFTRYRNNLQLTQTGERLIDHAETIILAWERARQDVCLSKKQKHVFSLGATSGLWDMFMQHSLHEVHRQMPELALRAESHNQDALIRSLMERTLDLALLYEPSKHHELVSLPIINAELILVSTKEGQSLDNALTQGYVSVDWGLAFQINIAQIFSDSLTPVLHTSLAKIALEFINTYGGCAYLPHSMINAQLGDTLFVVKEAPGIFRQVYACYREDNRYTMEIDCILNILRQEEPDALPFRKNLQI